MPVILTVDDSKSLRQTVAFTLRRAGYDVIEAVDGEDGIAKAMANPVALILADQNMPNMDGLTMLAAAPGDLAGLVPRHIVLKQKLSGVPVPELISLLRAAAQPGVDSDALRQQAAVLLQARANEGRSRAGAAGVLSPRGRNGIRARKLLPANRTRLKRLR